MNKVDEQTNLIKLMNKQVTLINENLKCWLTSEEQQTEW